MAWKFSHEIHQEQQQEVNGKENGQNSIPIISVYPVIRFKLFFYNEKDLYKLLFR